MLCSFADPVAILNNDQELQPNAVINIFSSLSLTGVQFISLICYGIQGHGELQWETRDVQRFPDVLDSNTDSNDNDLSIDYFTDDRRGSSLLLQPIAEDVVGFYTCKSTQSGYEATVFTTFQNPYFTFTSPTEYEVPLGVRVEISARYADLSNGIINLGQRYYYTLTFLPCVSPTDPSPTDQGSGIMPTEMIIPTEMLLEEGIVDSMSNNYIYYIYASESVAGQYNLTCKLHCEVMFHTCEVIGACKCVLL